MYPVKLKNPLRDVQQDWPDDYCEVCQGELWGDDADPDEFGRVICPECRHMMLKIRNRVCEGGDVA